MPQKRRRQSRRRWIPISQNRKKEIRTAYLFLLPSLLGVGGFVFLPFLDVIRRSFLQASGKGFVGAQNYQSVLLNEAFKRAAGNTARFMVICIPLLLLLSLCTALALRNTGVFQKAAKTGVLLPMAMPVASVAVCFQMIFDRHGWLNLLPVSYTHLDVYKRQGVSCTSRSSPWAFASSAAMDRPSPKCSLWLRDLSPR